MIKFYNPDKINISSFGNYVPHVHIHIQARFKNDEYFPEPMWGDKQRKKIYLNLPNIEDFLLTL
jgi:diadenosine tetraphosphate (Ap4A) HIT family hydrolase